MRVIFLDFDGVMNSTRSLLAAQRTKPTKDERDFVFELNNTYYSGYPLSMLTLDLLGIDPDCVGYLNLIVEASGAQVVVSSSWRFCHNLMGLQRLLEYRGFRGELVDITPINLVGPGKLRSHEIQAWLDINPDVEEFVILDDDEDMAHLKNHLVRSNKKVGLTEDEAKKAISIIITDSVRG
jgi:HAD domain in Swiss Army Knife RNA repair proteins